MDPREHHHFFAKRMIPTHTFQSTDKVFAELQGPRREAFLMFLWNEAGSAVHPKLPHVAVENGRLAKLDVVGAMRSGDQEIIVLSMPPAINPNEAAFIALARKPGNVSVFFLERCRDEAGTGVHPTEAVLAEVRADGSRVNHGFAPGLDLEAFKNRVGAALGVSLAGIENTLTAPSVAEFVAGLPASGGAKPAAAAPPGAKGKPVSVGPLLVTLLLLRAGLPVLFNVLGRVGLGGVLAPVWPFIGTLYLILSGLIGLLLIVWIYQVHAARREQASLSPGVALLFMLLPGLNFFLMPFALRSAWKATVGAGGGLLVFGWWLMWILEIPRAMLSGPGMTISRSEGSSEAALSMAGGASIHMPVAVADVVIGLLNYGFYITVLAYGLLWYIVKRVNERT